MCIIGLFRGIYGSVVFTQKPSGQPSPVARLAAM
jgi:hypothetical protein